MSKQRTVRQGSLPKRYGTASVSGISPAHLQIGIQSTSTAAVPPPGALQYFPINYNPVPFPAKPDP